MTTSHEYRPDQRPGSIRGPVRISRFFLECLLCFMTAGCLSWSSHAAETGGRHLVPLFPAASDAARQGFVRVINQSRFNGRVQVYIQATDDEGRLATPVTLTVYRGETIHFNSTDLEEGNAAKGLHTGIGSGKGDWWLTLDSDDDVEVLSYIRTPADGFLTSMHDLVPVDEHGRHHVAIFNPATNVNQESRLRLINPGATATRVTITGIDGDGEPAPGDVRLEIRAGAARTISAAELESGGAGIGGALGDGAGKWRLTITPDDPEDEPVHALSLLSTPSGHLTNLSTAPANFDGTVHRVPMFPAASDPLGRQGFVRVINRSDQAGEVTINAFDDSDRDFAASTLVLEPAETVHFNSEDLEMGNPGKGLSGGSGAGAGDWQLELTSDLDIEVLAYIRTTTDGFLTAMHDTVLREGNRNRVAIFNPGGNVNQVSVLRLVNAGRAAASVSIAGIGGTGQPSAGVVSLSVPAQATRNLTAQALEAGGDGFNGALGDAPGKWQLLVDSDRPIMAMSLLSSPTGHLTNLSTAPALDFAPASLNAFVDRVAGRRMVLADLGRRLDFPSSALPSWREAGGTEADRGDYIFRRTGRNRVRVEFIYRLGGQCRFELTFESRMGGNTRFTCHDGSSGESSWHIAERDEKPDLLVPTLRVSDTTPRTGAPFMLTAVVRNDGTVPAEEILLDFPYSEDDALPVSNLRRPRPEALNRGVLHPGESLEHANNTSETIPGTYYYRACVEDVTGDSNPANNCSSPVRVTVRPRTVDQFMVHRRWLFTEGITYADGRLYVLGASERMVFAFTPSGERVPDADFRLWIDGIPNPVFRGITHAQGSFHILDRLDARVYAYTLSGERKPDADFDLDADNTAPDGITHANGRLHVLDAEDYKVYAYKLSGEREPDADFELIQDFLNRNYEPSGITYADGRLYVVGRLSGNRVCAYTPSGERDADADFGTESHSKNGIAYANGRFYVVERVQPFANVHVYAPAPPGERNPRPFTSC